MLLCVDAHEAMSLSRLEIHSLRCLQSLVVEPHPQSNLILGANGSGKTTLLEAIHLLATGRSFRSRLLNALIANQGSSLSIMAQLKRPEAEFSIGLERRKEGDNRLRLSGQDASLADVASLMPVQLLTPESLSLLTEGPAQRRQFMDWGLFHQNPAFIGVWSRWKRLLLQRNAALKSARTYADVSVWDSEWLALSEQIAAWRKNYVEQLEPVLQQLLPALLGKVEIRLSLYSGWERGRDLASVMRDSFERDLKLGHSSHGPQKADLRLRIQGQAAEQLLSRGEQKLLVIALKLAQGQLLDDSHRRYCLWLLDDLSSELDLSRRQSLGQQLAQLSGQLFVTGISPDLAEALLPAGAGSRFWLADGQLQVH